MAPFHWNTRVEIQAFPFKYIKFTVCQLYLDLAVTNLLNYYRKEHDTIKLNISSGPKYVAN